MDKEVVILVGSMGSGKSTYCEKYLNNYFRISQDEQGKKEHFDLYLDAIKQEKPLIVIDRINHLRKQRKKYIDIAKKNNYKTKIIVMNLDFKTCYNRIINRKNHPNLNFNSNKNLILKALRMYFKEYEFPLNEEANKVIFKTNYDPYLLDLTKFNFENFLIIGDVHGCYDELIELIKLNKQKFKFNENKTAIILTGDLFDRGNKNKEVFEFVFNNKLNNKNNIFTILGNHEDKLKRYLRGNNISITGGLDETINQLNLYDINSNDSQNLLFNLESLPYIIKISNNDFVVHGGINPLKSIYKQNKTHILYLRTFNQIHLNSDLFFDGDDPFWFENYSEKNPNIYFGHNYHEKIQVKKNVFALDGYCVFGKKLRSIFLEKIKTKKISNNNNNFSKHILEIKAKKQYSENNFEQINNNSLINQYKKFVLSGYINKNENENLIQFNYTERCIYDKYWNNYTLNARGIIFDKKTETIIARPFKKFFNLGENEESLLNNLPLNLKYEVFEKVDGTLGILYYYNSKWNISTRGSLKSKQSIEAEKILKKYNIKYLNKNYTYLVEIIYPENKIIVDYKKSRKLILLGCKETKSGNEMNYEYLKKISKLIKMPIIKKFDYSINDILELKNKLSKNEEGFVIKFENNLKLKIKGLEYLKLAKIKTNISPISLWEVMVNGKVDKKYLFEIPEEILPEIKKIVYILENNYKKIKNEIMDDIKIIPFNLKEKIDETEKKKIVLYINSHKSEFLHPNVLLYMFLNKKKQVEDYIMKLIKPIGNKLK